jgi:hypothetical protein
MYRRKSDMKKKIGSKKDESPAQVIDARIEELALALARLRLHRVAVRSRVILLPTGVVFVLGKVDEIGT